MRRRSRRSFLPSLARESVRAPPASLDYRTLQTIIEPRSDRAHEPQVPNPFSSRYEREGHDLSGKRAPTLLHLDPSSRRLIVHMEIPKRNAPPQSG